MSACGETGTTTGGTCAPKSQESSEGLVEGQWVGISIGIWVLIMVIVWVVRTCMDKTRRQRALHRYCCRGKGMPESSVECGGSGQTPEGPNGTVYYTPCSPPSYEEAVRGSPRPLRSKNGLANGNVPSDGAEALAAFSKGRHVPTLGLKKCRTTLSTMSLSLEPIQEDLNEPRHNSTPRLPSSKQHRLERDGLPSRCTSHPAKLATLGVSACHFSCGSEEPDESEGMPNVGLTMNGSACPCKDGSTAGDVAVNNVKNQTHVIDVDGKDEVSAVKKDNKVIMGINLNGDSDSASDDEKENNAKSDEKDVVVNIVEPRTE